MFGFKDIKKAEMKQQEQTFYYDFKSVSKVP